MEETKIGPYIDLTTGKLIGPEMPGGGRYVRDDPQQPLAEARLEAPRAHQEPGVQRFTGKTQVVDGRLLREAIKTGGGTAWFPE